MRVRERVTVTVTASAEVRVKVWLEVRVGCAEKVNNRQQGVRHVYIIKERMCTAAGEGSQNGPAGTAPTGRLFLSYHSLASLILALAQREGQVCDGDAVLLLSNHSNFSCRMEHSVGNFSSTAACLPSST